MTSIIGDDVVGDLVLALRAKREMGPEASSMKRGRLGNERWPGATPVAIWLRSYCSSKMNELPRPFDNDDEEAAAHALGRLNQAVSEAQAEMIQDALIERALRFMRHEQAKRMRGSE